MVICLQESVKASFCESDETVRVAYADLITSSKETLDSILELQEVCAVLKLEWKKIVMLSLICSIFSNFISQCFSLYVKYSLIAAFFLVPGSDCKESVSNPSC